MLNFNLPFFNSLLPKIHSDIKMLYDFVIKDMYKIFEQKEMYLFLYNYMYSKSKFTGAYFCLLI